MIFASLVVVVLAAAFSPAVSAQESRGAISIGDNTIGVFSADADADEEARILELRARLAELLREQMATIPVLERQAAIQIADLTSFWVGAIEELRIEVEREIRQVTSDYELKAKRLLFNSDGDTSPRRLQAELNAFIEEKWAWFEIESGRKRQYLRDDIAEIEQAKDFDLEYLSSLIHEIESEINLLLESTTESTESSTDQARDVTPVEEREQQEPTGSAGLIHEETADQVPETSASEESRHNRGFFFNSISVDPNGLNAALDTTALAVIGILITLAAAGVQLLRGN